VQVRKGSLEALSVLGEPPLPEVGSRFVANFRKGMIALSETLIGNLPPLERFAGVFP